MFTYRRARPHTSSVTSNKARVSHSASCAMKPANVLVIRFNLSELYERLFYGRFEWCMCVRNRKQAVGVSKANSASSHIWLKTNSESIQNRWRENRDGSIFFLPPILIILQKIYISNKCCSVKLSIHQLKKVSWFPQKY